MSELKYLGCVLDESGTYEAVSYKVGGKFQVLLGSCLRHYSCLVLCRVERQ